MQARTFLIVLSIAIAGCTAIDRQKAQPPVADDLHFHNLQVLPSNISREELVRTMRGYSLGLGVRCGFCHVPKPNVAEDTPLLERFDFASDAKDEKIVTRSMIRMTQVINDDYIRKLGRGEHQPEEFRVTCWTCHRGEEEPAITPTGPPPGAPAAPAEAKPGR